MITLQPSEETIAEAREWCRRADELKPNELANVAPLEQRAEGRLAEKALHRWLELRGEEHEWNGGPDGKPDFVIRGQDVGVRITAHRRGWRGAWSSEHLIYLFDDHLLRGAPHRFFVGIERPTRRTALLGGTTLERFLDSAWHLEPGRELCRGFVAQHPMFVNYAGVLTAPEAWLESL